MSTHDSGRNATRKWLRLATGLAVTGVLALGSGGVVIAGAQGADAAQANGQEKIGVCHRTASSTNPYVYLSVPADEANGHITGTGSQHNHKVTWDSDGTWRGVPHVAGDLRLDYYASQEEIDAGRCFDTTEPTEEPTTEPTTEPTEEPSTEPTTEPTDEPTEEPTEQPSTEPTDPSTEPTDPSTESGDSRRQSSGGTTSPDEQTEAAPRAEERAPTAVPRRVDAGVSGDTTMWGAGLIGGGSALLLSSGGVVLGVKRFEDD